ncbi:hypothetical protein EXIGLDRAFT_775947 [Exidia glandulosa HHB12029]|uniref:Uncharacterized protein n=1 Tax=Exidia glandulosa HHB12029 TaxID=1314781 RepID=A0A165DNZ3_EXIGL|nr:hypothetical protein EXIGLDRAFT_775947 [Exidia glandulosa HHB12029]
MHRPRSMPQEESPPPGYERGNWNSDDDGLDMYVQAGDSSVDTEGDTVGEDEDEGINIPPSPSLGPAQRRAQHSARRVHFADTQPPPNISTSVPATARVPRMLPDAGLVSAPGQPFPLPDAGGWVCLKPHGTTIDHSHTTPTSPQPPSTPVRARVHAATSTPATSAPATAQPTTPAARATPARARVDTAAHATAPMPTSAPAPALTPGRVEPDLTVIGLVTVGSEVVDPQVTQDLRHPRHRPGRSLRPVEMDKFIHLRLAHGLETTLAEQAGIQATYSRVVWNDGRDDARRSGGLHLDFLDDEKERERAWAAYSEDRVVVLTEGDRSNDSLSFGIFVKASTRAGVVDKSNIDITVYMPRALMEDGQVKPRYAALDTDLKNVVLHAVGYEHVRTFGRRMEAGGVYHERPTILPLSPHVPRTFPPITSKPSLGPNVRASTRAPTLPLLRNNGSSTPGTSSRRAESRAQRDASDCAVCARVGSLDDLILHLDRSHARLDMAGKVVVRARGPGGYTARSPLLFADLGLPQDDEKRILETLNGLEESDLYAGLTAMGVCVFHVCLLVQTAVLDKTAGLPILGVHSQ